jgi:hypothetical protein
MGNTPFIISPTNEALAVGGMVLSYINNINADAEKEHPEKLLFNHLSIFY